MQNLNLSQFKKLHSKVDEFIKIPVHDLPITQNTPNQLHGDAKVVFVHELPLIGK